MYDNFMIVIDEVDDNEEKHLKTYFKLIVDKSKSTFTWKNVSKRLPILQWWPVYSSEDCIGDLLAGITVGLTLIPQSISYATLADLPPQVKYYKTRLSAIKPTQTHTLQFKYSKF